MAEVVQETVKRKRRGRPRLSDALIQFRLPYNDSDFLTAVSIYEGRDKAELLRSLFLKLKKEYRKSPSFRRWTERHAKELQAISINQEDLF